MDTRAMRPLRFPKANGHVREATRHVREATGHVRRATGHIRETAGRVRETDGHKGDAAVEISKSNRTRT
jgi:hypothetical protein